MRNSENPAGALRARTMVEVVDIWGHRVMRSVIIGRVHCVSLPEAQEMVERARMNNPERAIHAEFKVSL